MIDLALVDPGLLVVGELREDRFGSSLAGADVSGDGITDLVVGCKDSPASGSRFFGAVEVLLGPLGPGPTRFLATTPPDVRIFLNEAGIEWGGKVAAGDVSGDGVADVLMAAMGATSSRGDRWAGRTLGVLGPLAAGTTIDLRTTPPDILIEGGEPGDSVGGTLLAHDLDRDGIRDLVIGVGGGDGIDNLKAEAGEVHVLFGPLPRGTVVDNRTRLPDITFTGEADGGMGGGTAAAPLPDGRTRLLLGAFGLWSCARGRIRVLDDLPPRGSIVDFEVAPAPPTVTSSVDELAGAITLLADLSGDSTPEIIFGVAADGPNQDRPYSDSIFVVRPDDRCEEPPAGLGPHGIDVRRAGDDVLIDFDPARLGEDSIGVDVYRGTMRALRWVPFSYDHVLAANGCAVSAPPYVDAGAAAPGVRGYYYLATRGCPQACGPYRLTGDMGFKSTGEARPTPSRFNDALTCSR